MNHDKSIDNIYKLDGKVPVGKAIPFGLQHILAMFVANIAPILIVAGACGLSAAQTTNLVQCAMMIAGVGSLIQLFPLWKIGSGLPIVMGISFTFVSIFCVIGPEYATEVSWVRYWSVVLSKVPWDFLLNTGERLYPRSWRQVSLPQLDFPFFRSAQHRLAEAPVLRILVLGKICCWALSHCLPACFFRFLPNPILNNYRFYLALSLVIS